MGLRLWLYLPSVGLQGAVNRVHSEASSVFTSRLFQKSFGGEELEHLGIPDLALHPRAQKHNFI